MHKNTAKLINSIAIYDVIKKKWVPVKVPEFVKNKKESSISVTRQSRVFTPGLIHSIDGYIVRQAVLNLYNQTKYIMNHVHDSFSVHPNFLKKLNNVIYSIYQNCNT
jgi:DNA-directed RNA polymerase